MVMDSFNPVSIWFLKQSLKQSFDYNNLITIIFLNKTTLRKNGFKLKNGFKFRVLMLKKGDIRVIL